MMSDKTQIAILKGIIFGMLFGVTIGVILGVTTGQSGIGINGGVSMVIAGAVGFSIMNIRKLNK